ncbi:ferredoxin [Poseidonocella pacifica]|uniref:ferredoxin n=1 Tax=Poseidonocella pacifica TaxID=871651 RepID=UPI001FDF86FB|nr:ferredoxin [Poseidonocella pacifica]
MPPRSAPEDLILGEPVPRGLRLFGGFSPTVHDLVPGGTRVILLLAPQEPEFWSVLRASDEYGDGMADPLDRWSRRVIGNWATDLGGTALFPFDGPPYRPFVTWAFATGRAFPSPLGLAMDRAAGLFLSLRGAVALPVPVPLPEAQVSPCASCAGQPCKSACPVGAFQSESYDASACREWTRSVPGAACRHGGCAARRACPFSARRLPEQSAFHMTTFLE